MVSFEKVNPRVVELSDGQIFIPNKYVPSGSIARGNVVSYWLLSGSRKSCITQASFKPISDFSPPVFLSGLFARKVFTAFIAKGYRHFSHEKSGGHFG
jgi:hypothetical protein